MDLRIAASILRRQFNGMRLDGKLGTSIEEMAISSRYTVCGSTASTSVFAIVLPTTRGAHFS